MVLAGIYEKRRREKFLAEGIAIGEALACGAMRAKSDSGSGHARGAGVVAEPAPPSGLAAMETHQRWLAWNLRRLQTEARNDIFTEPPPALASAANAAP